MFSCPSGAKVSWSRAPPPKVTTITFLFFIGDASARAVGLKRSSAPPRVTPAAVRRNSRRVQASWRLISSGEDTASLAKLLPARDERKDVMSTTPAPILWQQGRSSPNIQTAGLLLSAYRDQPCAESGLFDKPGTVPERGLSRRCERRPARAGNSRPPNLDSTSTPIHILGWPRNACSDPSRNCPTANALPPGSDRESPIFSVTIESG